MNSFTKTSESPSFVMRFVEQFFDPEIESSPSPEAKLSGFQKLEAGWYNGRGKPISEEVIRVANHLIRKANGDAIRMVDVFPRADGGVIVAVYFSTGGDLAFSIKPDCSVDIDSESIPNFPSAEGLSENFVLLVIQTLSQWNSYSSFTSLNTMRTSIPLGFEALASRDQAMVRGFRFLRGSVANKQRDQYVLMPGLSMAR